MPLGSYTKVVQSDGTILYVDENGLPLSGWHLPKTGDDAPVGMLLALMLLSATGAALLLLPKGRGLRSRKK